MRLRCPIVLALMAALISVSAIGVGAVRLTIYDVAETKVTGYGTEFGQVFRSPCDGSLVSVSIGEHGKRRTKEPVQIEFSIHEGDRFADVIGPRQTVTINPDHRHATAEWGPGEVPLRAAYSYYLRLVGNRHWKPAMQKKEWGRQPYWSGCAFADDGVVVIPQPDHDLVATLVVDTVPAKAVVHAGPTTGEASAGDLAPWWRVVNAGGSDLWAIGAGDGTAVDEIVTTSPALIVLGQGERALVESPAVAWFDGSANLLRNGNFEFGNSYWQRCPDAPVVHGTDVMLSQSLRSRFRDKSTYHVWLPSNLPTGDSVCVSSSPVAVKPDTEYYVGGVYSAEFVEGAEALLSVLETDDNGATREKFLMQLGRYAEWQPAAQRLRTGPRARQARLKFSLTTISGGETLWDALYLVAADDVKLAQAGVGEEPTAHWSEDLLARGLEALRAGDTVTAARSLTQVLAKSPASSEARQAMHHLLDPWAEADSEQAWAAWHKAMLARHPMPPPQNGDRSTALVYLRMGQGLAARDWTEERIAECFERAMVWGDASLLPLEAAESARRCCAGRTAKPMLAEIAEGLPDAGEPWRLFLDAVYARNKGRPEEATAALRDAVARFSESIATTVATYLLAATDTGQGALLVTQNRPKGAVPFLYEAVAAQLPPGAGTDLRQRLRAVQADAVSHLAFAARLVAYTGEVDREVLDVAEEFLKTLELDEGEPAESTWNLAQYYLHIGDGRRAAEWATRSAEIALQLGPMGTRHVYFCRRTAVFGLEKAGEIEQAIAALRELIEFVRANEKVLAEPASRHRLQERLARLQATRSEK
jgi:tetratricopeptide (TPR) repeat protein